METAIIGSVQITKNQPELCVWRVSKLGVEEMVGNQAVVRNMMPCEQEQL